MTSLAITSNLKAIESHSYYLEREVARLTGLLSARDAEITKLSQSFGATTNVEKLAEMFDSMVIERGIHPAMQLFERALVRRALVRSRGNQREASRALGISRNAVARYAK